jgi:hypothetical protein
MFVGTQDLYHGDYKAGLAYFRIVYDHNGKLENYMGNHSVAFFLAQNRKARISPPKLVKKASNNIIVRPKSNERELITNDNLIASHHISNTGGQHFPTNMRYENDINRYEESLVYDGGDNMVDRSNVFSVGQSYDNMFNTEGPTYVFQHNQTKPPNNGFGGNDNIYNNYDYNAGSYTNMNTPNIKVFRFEDRKDEHNQPTNTHPGGLYGLSSGYYIPNAYNEHPTEYSYPLYTEPELKERNASGSLSRKDNSIGSLGELYQLYAQDRQKRRDEKGMSQLKDFTPGESLRCFSGQKTRFDTGNDFMPTNTAAGFFEFRNTAESFIHFKPESTEIYKYTFRDRKWSSLTNINNYKFPRYYALAEISEENILITGGEFEESTLNSAVYFSDEMFIEVADMKTPRKGHSSIFFDGYVYVFGGFLDDKTIIRECERYSFKTKVWERISNMIFTKAYATPVVMNGYIYLIGGFSSGKFEGVKFI